MAPSAWYCATSAATAPVWSFTPGGSTSTIHERSLMRLNVLIDRSLADVRLDAGLLHLERIPVCEILEEVEIGASIVAQARGLTFEVTTIDRAVIVRADRQILAAALANLIQNALTYTARGAEVSLRARRDTSGGALFTVADNGPGIPPEYHELIFRKFERVKNPETPRVRSSGLGLAFCKLAIDAHGGRIWVRSEEGKGSRFHFVIPVQPGPRRGVSAA